MRCRSYFFACLASMLLATAAVKADEPETASNAKAPSEAFIRRMKTIMDVVLDNHVEPPARQQMFLGGMRHLLQKAQPPAPADLPARISELTTDEQFAAFLKKNWPDQPKSSADVMEEAFTQGMLRAVPGPTRFVTAKEYKIEEQVRANRYVGTGIQIRVEPESKLTQIITPFPGGPARKAGAKPNDLIVEVDGVKMAGKTLLQVVEALRGE